MGAISEDAGIAGLKRDFGDVYAGRTGQKRHDLETSRPAWPRPPLACGPDRLCIVSDCCRLVGLDPAAGHVAWSHTFPRPSTSVAAPQLAGDGKVLLALVDGWQIERLDPVTGKSLWVTGDPRWSAGDVLSCTTPPTSAPTSSCTAT